MVSKNQIKLINSLHQKKYRNLHNLFVVEGEKGVVEFLESNLKLYSLYCTDSFNLTHQIKEAQIVIDSELKKISALKTPNKVLAVFYKPEFKKSDLDGLILVLDKITDPGNLGTIIRLCDWFKVSQLVCSLDTVDCFNPKVVQATMGSLTRISMIYTDILLYLKTTNLPIFASAMDGENIYNFTLPKKAVLVMGNEANGITNQVFKLATNKLAIPRFNDSKKPESLNVATATAILLSEFSR